MVKKKSFKKIALSFSFYGVRNYKTGKLLSNHQNLSDAKKDILKRSKKSKTATYFIQRSKNIIEFK